MKIIGLIFIVSLLWLSLPFSAIAIQDNLKLPETELKGVDAKTALQIANQWKWSRNKIKSYVNTREVVFKFSDGKITKIPLPENEIVIAVAPYIKKTHK